MAKNQRKIHPSSSSVVSHHHFFKVYLPALSSHHLKVPASFTGKFNGGLPEKAILRDHFQRLWHVEVAKVENNFFFHRDWQDFVNHHCLKLGDFLVFSYNGNYVFDVRIFDNSECEREDSMDYAIHGSKNPPFVRKEIVSEALETNNRPVCDSERNDSEKCRKEMEKTKISDVEFNKDKVLDAACFVDPKSPHFIVSVKSKRPYDLHIPKQVVIDHNLELKPDMILRDPSGKSWPVKVYFRKDRRTIISRGWFAFWTQNKLENGDQCILEFNTGSGGTSNIINVYILLRQKLQQTTGENEQERNKVKSN